MNEAKLRLLQMWGSQAKTMALHGLLPNFCDSQHRPAQLHSATISDFQELSRMYIGASNIVAWRIWILEAEPVPFALQP